MNSTKNMLDIIGKNFNGYRKKYGISMYKLSKITMVSTHTIAAFEKGEANVTLNTMLKLCNAIELNDIASLFKK